MQTPSWFLKRSITAYLLWPLSVLYYLASKAVYFIRKNFKQGTPAVAGARPVICIGNIFAGGVGKTPIVRQIAQRFHSPVVMRGYKKVGNKMGDEATMLQRDGLSVFVGDRVKSIKNINKKNHKAPIVMDDGFQNPTVKKNISILVFDESLGLGNGFIIPAGPLREPLSAIKRADAVIIMRSENRKAESGNLKSKILNLKPNMPVFYAVNKNTLPDGVSNFIAFAGIGYPQKFFDNLPIRPVKSVPFPDHYQYADGDIEELMAMAAHHNADLVTTEKDWVRLSKSVRKKVKVAKLDTFIDPEFWTWLKKRLIYANI